MIGKYLEFAFKGNRSYIQGPDLYNANLEQFSQCSVTDIHFSAHGFIRKNRCILYIADEKPEMQKRFSMPIQCRLLANNERKYLFVQEEATDYSSPKRIPYDESLVLELCQIDDESISIAGTSPYSFIETIVSMKKALLSKLYPHADGRWLFTKIDLARRFEKQNDLQVKLLHNLKFKLIKSGVFHEGAHLGDIFFSLVNK